MDEVFGPQNFCSQIAFKKTSGAGSFAIGTNLLPAIADYIIWYGKVAGKTKYRQIYRAKAGDVGTGEYTSVQMPDGSRGPTSGSAGESDGRLYRKRLASVGRPSFQYSLMERRYHQQPVGGKPTAKVWIDLWPRTA
jgi:hypothetical protein